MARIISAYAQARVVSLDQEVPGSGVERRPCWTPDILAKTIRPPHSTSISLIDQRPGTRDRLAGHPQLHAKDSTALWTLRANGPISHPEGTERFPKADNLLHRIVSTPGRPQTHSQVGRCPGGTTGRPNAHPSLRASTARTVDDGVF